MPATFFIGDPHFGHEKVSLIRGFADTDIHDASISQKWERQVKPDDLVYVMGDISGGSRSQELDALHILNKLPGRKRLVCGNHDSISGIHRTISSNREMFYRVFEKISDYSAVKFEGRRILLSHYPYLASGDGPGRGVARYEQYRLPDLGAYLIHAHTHHTHPTDGGVTGREICVSWDAWRRLVDMGDIARLIKDMSVNPQEELYREMEQRRRREQYHVDKETTR